MSGAVVSGWHNITGGTPSVKVDGVLYQDIISILESLKKDKTFTSYKEAIDLILAHTVNDNNPHGYSREELANQVSSSFYEKWLSEGYRGTVEEFYETVYRYIEYATNEDMLQGTSESLVPSVKAFYDRVLTHNEEVSDDIHTYTFGKFRVKAPVENMPQISLHQFIGIPNNFSSNENTETRVYENVNVGFLSTKLSISLHGTYHSGEWLRIATNRNNTGSNYFGVRVDTTEKRVQFFYRKSSTAYNYLTIPIENLLEEINNSPEHITMIMTIDNNDITGYVQLSSTYQDIPIYSSIANIEDSKSVTVDTTISYRDCIVSCPRMLPGDYLEDLTIYSKVLSKDGIYYIFDVFN